MVATILWIRRLRLLRVSLTALALTFAAQAARGEKSVYVPPACGGAEAAGDEAALLRCYAPVFVVEQGSRSYNRVGTPEIRLERGKEKVRVNPDVAAAFTEVRRDRIGQTSLLQLLYRVHFTRLPFKPSVFFEMHRNVGVLAIVTLRESDLQPLLFTTVYTCGCYRALLPDLFPPEALPTDWPAKEKRFFGKTLPAIVRHPEPGRSRLTVRLASKTHRVYEVETLEEPPLGSRVDLPVRAIEELRRLPVAGSSGAFASFFYTDGPLKGHVRGAWSPIEGLLAGPLFLDLTLGMDKDFGDPKVTGTPFYTSLLPWKREVSRLDRFDPLMRHLGFRLEPFKRESAPAAPAQYAAPASPVEDTAAAARGTQSE